MDLVPSHYGWDANGLLYNPLWRYELDPRVGGDSTRRGSKWPLLPNAVEYCRQRTSDGRAPGPCSNQISGVDSLIPLRPICEGAHINWFPATVDGLIRFESRTEWPQDWDYFFALSPRDSAALISSSDPGSNTHFDVEFDWRETTARFSAPLWRHLDYDAYHDPLVLSKRGLNPQVGRDRPHTDAADRR